jgi:hypothetical protein
MDLREILAEKIRAASGRARYRDFYDIAMIAEGLDGLSKTYSGAIATASCPDSQGFLSRSRTLIFR